MKKIIIIIVLILVAVVVFFSRDKNEETEVTKQDEFTEEVAGFEGDFLDYQAVLKDVTGGDDVRRINTGGEASGEAIAGLDDDAGAYSLAASFQGLPEPTGTDFYEGWVVRQSPLDVVSTGRVEKNGEQFFNVFSSSEDLLDHTLYILTIEPDDGDPAPADHILEGTMTKK